MGGLLGLEKQVVANGLQISWGLLKGGGVIPILLLISPSVEVFFGWQLIVNFAYVLALRATLIKLIKVGHQNTEGKIIDLALLKQIWRFSAGILLLGVLSSFVSQFDKLIVSKWLPISDLAVYTLAAAISLAPLIFAYPLGVAVYPRFTNMFSKGEVALVNVLIAKAVTISLYSPIILLLWTQDLELSSKAWLVTSVLVYGQLFLALQVIPYYIGLAKGDIKINILIGGSGLLVLICLFSSGLMKREMVFISSLLTGYHVLTSIIYIYWVLKKHTSASPVMFLIRYALFPFAVVSSFSVIFNCLKPESLNMGWNIIYITLSSAVSFTLAIMICFRVKPRQIINFLKKDIF
jgi:O-antigen/teichoic acid export membrane protein